MGVRKQLKTPEAEALHARLTLSAEQHIHGLVDALAELPSARDRRQRVVVERDRHLAAVFDGVDGVPVDDDDEQTLRDAWHAIQSVAVRHDPPFSDKFAAWLIRLASALADVVASAHARRAAPKTPEGAWVWVPAADACTRCRVDHLLPNGQPRVRRGKPKLVHPGCACELRAVAPDALPGHADGTLGDVEADLAELARLRAVGGAGRVGGFEVFVENPVGSTREWPGGKTRMRVAYGYVVGAPGSDGDALDCYLGTDPQAPLVYVVHQAAPDGSYDEDKAMLFFPDLASARAAYLMHRNDGERAVFGVAQVDVEDFKQRLASPLFDGFLKAEPARADASVFGSSLDPAGDAAFNAARAAHTAESPRPLLDAEAFIREEPEVAAARKRAADARRESWRAAIDPSPTTAAGHTEVRPVDHLGDAEEALDALAVRVEEAHRVLEARLAAMPGARVLFPAWVPGQPAGQ